MRRMILSVLGLTLACGGVAAGHQLTSTDGDDVSGKFDIKTLKTTHTKSSFTFQITLYDDVADADFTSANPTPPPSETFGPQILEGLKGNRVCVQLERRVAADIFPKQRLACTGDVVGAKLTGKLYSLQVGIKGSPTTIAASRSGRTITLVVPKSKLPKAKTTRLLAHTQFLDTKSCAAGCWDLKATNRQQHSG